MSEKLNDLINELGSEGALEAQGMFGLDEEKAREKMGQFQLQHEHGYVLEFVQMASLLGASTVSIEADADEFTMSWVNAEPWSKGELESLYSSVFSRSEGLRDEALKHLAIGLNAASARKLSVQRVEFVDVEGVCWRREQLGEHVQLEQGGELSEVGASKIYLKEKFRAGHLSEFFGKMMRDVEEIALIRQMCTHSRMTLVLNGEELTGVFELEPQNHHYLATEYKDLGDTRVWFALVSGTNHVSIKMVQHGVSMGGLEYVTNGVVGAEVLLESTTFKKDISRSSLVQDDEFWALVRDVVLRTINDLIADKLEQLWAKEDAVHILARTLHEYVKHKDFDHEQSRLLKMARSYPMFQLAHRLEGEATRRFRSFNEILALYESQHMHHRVLYHSARVSDVLEESNFLVLALEIADEARLGFSRDDIMLWFARRGDITIELGDRVIAELEQGAKNRMTWEIMPQRQDFATYQGMTVKHHVKHKHNKVEGEWLWSWREGDTDGFVHYYKEGRFLYRELLGLSEVKYLDDKRVKLMGGVNLFVEVPIEMDGAFAQKTLDGPHVNWLARVAKSFAGFMDQWFGWLKVQPVITPKQRMIVLGYLKACAEGWFFDALNLRLHNSTSHGNVNDLRAFSGMNCLKLETMLDESNPALRLEVLARLGEVSNVRIFTLQASGTGETRQCSLRELEKLLLHEGRHISWLRADDSILKRLNEFDTGREFLILDEEEQYKVEDLLSSYLLSNVSGELARALKKKEFLKRPVASLNDFAREDVLRVKSRELKGHATVLYIKKVADLSELTGGGRVRLGPESELEVKGTLFFGGHIKGQCTLELFYEQRLLGSTRFVPFYAAECVARVDVSGLKMRDNYTWVEKSVAFEHLKQRIARELNSLVLERFEALMARINELDLDEIYELWGYVFRAMAPENKEGVARYIVQAVRKAEIFEVLSGHSSRCTVEKLTEFSEYQNRVSYVFDGEEIHDELRMREKNVLVVPDERCLSLFKVYNKGIETAHVAKSGARMESYQGAKALFLERNAPVRFDELPSEYSAGALYEEVVEMSGKSVYVAWLLDTRKAESSLGGVKIELLYQGRALQHVTKLLYTGQMFVRMDVSEFPVELDFDEFVNGKDFSELIKQVTGVAYALLVSAMEKRLLQFEEIHGEERLMWLRYMAKVRDGKNRPSNYQDMKVKQLMLELPLFRTVNGELWGAEEVEDMVIKHSSSKLTSVVPGRVGEVVVQDRELVFVMPEGELDLWRDVFGKLIFAEYEPPRVVIDADLEQAVTSEPAVSSAKKKDVEVPKVSTNMVVNLEDVVASRAEDVCKELTRRMLSVRSTNHGRLSLVDELVSKVDIDAKGGESIRVEKGGIRLGKDHVALVKVMAEPGNEMMWLVLLSSVYSVINEHYREITDQHEEYFLRSLAEVR